MSKTITEENAKDALQPDPEDAYTKVSIDRLVENAWNPNSVSPGNFASLKKDIERQGGNQDQPVMVRVNPDDESKYEIIDGAHRYRAMKELGFLEVIVIVKEMDDKEARLKTISMNKLRGDFEQIKLAELIHDLKNVYGVSDEDIKEYLGYTPEEVESYEALVEFDFEAYAEDALPVETPGDESIMQDITIQCTDVEKLIFDTILRKLKESKLLTEEPVDQAEAIAIACEYLMLQLADSKAVLEDLGMAQGIVRAEEVKQEAIEFRE